MMEMLGGEAVARMYKLFGAGPIFGMGGFQTLPFYDATRRLGLAHHLVNDERAAVFMADAYSKTSGGRVGLADATLGPGATNLVTGLVESLNSGTPLVVLVGDASVDHSGKNMTQESRQAEILRPACKDFIRIERVHRIPELVRRAFSVATSGRPGPVVLCIPEGVSHESFDFPDDEFHVNEIYSAAPALRTRPDRESVAEAARMLLAAERPVIMAGGGVHISGAQRQLTAFAETMNIPVAHTMTGKGSIACTHPLSLGLFGRYDRIANRYIDDSDLLLVLGCKLGEIATKRYTVPATRKPIVHLDILAEEFGRTTEPTVMLWGDVKVGIADLSDAIGDAAAALHDRLTDHAVGVSAAMERWRDEVSVKTKSAETPINVARIFDELNNTMPADGVLVADGGFAGHWGALLYDTKQPGRGFVPDRGFASIGYGVPGGTGASLAAPGKQVVAVTGDGGFNMMLGEMETARRLKAKFVAIILNNAASGYVKALQHLMYGANAYNASDLSEINYANTAEAMEIKGIRVTSPDELRPALEAAFAHDGPCVLDVVVTRDPARMLPEVDSRTATIAKGDRIA